MLARCLLVTAGLSTLAMGQNTSLPMLPTGAAYLWGPPTTTSQVFFDMTVNTTITLQSLNYAALTPLGQAGTVSIFLTNTGITTYVGNELIPGNWSQVATGPSTIPLAPAQASVCFTNGAVVQPGTYGVAVRYTNCDSLFYLGTGSNQNFANTELSVTCGATQSGAFNVAPFSPYVFYGTLFYGLGAVAHNCGTAESYGRGCIPNSGSYYQRFLTASATAAALNGRRLTHQYTTTGYLVTPSVGVNYITPTAAAVSLPANNNLQTAVSLPSALQFPGGSTTQLYVSTNGYVSDTALQAPPGSISYMPHEYGLLQAGATVWALAFHDYITSEAGSGLIKYEQVGNLFVITYDGVESFPAAYLNPTRMQIQFDLVTNDVHYVWVTMDAIGGSAWYDQTVVGFSPAGPSPDVGSTDIPTLTSLLLTVPEVLPLTLTATAPPVLGTSVGLITSNAGNASLGVNFLSTIAIPAPGIDLGLLGAPGCAGLVDIAFGVGNLISNLGGTLPGMTVTVPLPGTASLAGIVVASQSVWLDPAANPFGIQTSNGVTLTLGLFAL